MRSGVFASNSRSHLPHNLITTFVLIAFSGLISLGSTVYKLRQNIQKTIHALVLFCISFYWGMQAYAFNPISALRRAYLSKIVPFRLSFVVGKNVAVAI